MLCTPDPYFNAYGALHVEIDGRVIVDQPAAGAYATQQVFTVGVLNETIAPYGALEISIWNAHAASDDEIQLGVRFTHDSEPFSTTAQTQALAPSELRRAVSSPAEGGLDPETAALITEIEKVSDGIGHVATAVGLVNSGVGTLASFADAGINSQITAATANELSLALNGDAFDGALYGDAQTIRAALIALRDGFTATEITAAAKTINDALTSMGPVNTLPNAAQQTVEDLATFVAALQLYGARLRDQQTIVRAVQALPQNHTDIVNAVQDLGVEVLNGFPRMLEDLRLLIFYNHVANPAEPLATNLTNVRAIRSSLAGLLDGLNFAELTTCLATISLAANRTSLRALNGSPANAAPPVDAGDVVDKRLDAIILNLRTLHDDPGDIATLNKAIKTAIDTERDAVVAAIDTLPKSHADIVAAVNAIDIDAFNGMPAAIAAVNGVLADADNAGAEHTADRRAALIIRNAMTGLLDGFDLAELELAIRILTNAENRTELKNLEGGPAADALITPLIRPMRELALVPHNVHAADEAITAALRALPQDHQDLIRIIAQTGVDLPTIRSHLADLTVFTGASAADRLALGAIRSGLDSLLNGFDLYELESVIAVLKLNIPKLSSAIPKATVDELKAVLYNLERQHETAPTLQSTDNASLFARQTYRPGAQTALVDMKGHKNMIIIFEADPAAAGYGRGSTFTVDTPVVGTFRAVDFQTPITLTYTWYRLTAFNPNREGPEIRGLAAGGFALDQPLTGLGSATAAPNEWIDYQGIDAITTTAKHIRVNIRDTLPRLTSRNVGRANDAPLYQLQGARAALGHVAPSAGPEAGAIRLSQLQDRLYRAAASWPLSSRRRRARQVGSNSTQGSHARRRFQRANRARFRGPKSNRQILHSRLALVYHAGCLEPRRRQRARGIQRGHDDAKPRHSRNNDAQRKSEAGRRN